MEESSSSSRAVMEGDPPPICRARIVETFMDWLRGNGADDGTISLLINAGFTTKLSLSKNYTCIVYI